MLETKHIEDFKKVVKFYEINRAYIVDVIRAIIEADKLRGSNEKALDVDKFFCCETIVTEYLNCQYTGSIQTSPLPDVQVMRVLCDSLIVCLAKLNKVPEGVHLTSEASSYVVTLVGRSMKSTEYSDMEECERVMRLLVESCASEESFKETFEFISQSLEKMSRVKRVFDNYDFSRVYLPEEFSAHGFNVTRTKTRQLREVPVEFLEKFILCTFIVESLNAWIQHIYSNGKTSDTAILKRFEYLDSYVSRYSDILPINLSVTGNAGYVITIPSPQFSNSAERYLFEQCFNVNGVCSRDSVVAMLKILGVED